MKPFEILIIIFMLIPVALVTSAFRGVYLFDLEFHATMLFVAWPCAMIAAFIGSLIREIWL